MERQPKIPPSSMTITHRILSAVRTDRQLWQGKGSHPVSPSIAEAGGIEEYISLVREDIGHGKGGISPDWGRVWESNLRSKIAALTDLSE